MNSFYLIQAINESSCLRGRITPSGSGFNYTSYTQNGSSRKPKATIDACIPRKFDGYIVTTTTPHDAVDLTNAYRAAWPIISTLGGIVRTVRDGRIEA